MCLEERFWDLDWTGTGIALLGTRHLAAVRKRSTFAPETQKCLGVRYQSNPTKHITRTL